MSDQPMCRAMRFNRGRLIASVTRWLCGRAEGETVYCADGIHCRCGGLLFSFRGFPTVIVLNGSRYRACTLQTLKMRVKKTKIG